MITPSEVLGLLTICVVGMSVLAMLFAAYSRRLAFKQRKLEIEAGVQGDSGTSQVVAQLEQRVRVLERIATERGQDVAHQIEALRDDRAQLESRKMETQS